MNLTDYQLAALLVAAPSLIVCVAFMAAAFFGFVEQ
jgi:hypothetical protein